MQLSRVRIRNFRNFADLTIDPFPNPAVVVGENGVGKSNLLHGLRLVLDPDLPDRRRWLQADDVHDGGPSLAEGVEVSVEVELTDFDDDVDARSELDGAIVGTAPLVARLTYLFRPKTSLGSALGTAAALSLTPDQYEWTIFGAADPSNAMLSARRYAALSVLPALRDAEGDLGRSDRSPLTRLLRELPPSEANLNDALTAMQEARDKLGRDRNVRKVRRMIQDRVTAMAGPQLPLSPSLAFAGRREDLLRSVQLFVDAAGKRGVDRTSTGAANMLYLALLLERLRLRRESGDGEDTLLAVEEPEAHLHPTLQRHVFAHLLGQPDRLILTTHSPHIAAVTPLDSIVLLSETTRQSVARVVPPGVLTSAEQTDIERYLNVTRAEVLFARRVILVEGAADSYLLPALAAATDFDLDGHGIVVASVEGADFVPYGRLLGSDALDRPFKILTDGDVAGADRPQDSEPGLFRARGLLELRAPGAHDDFGDRLMRVAATPVPEGDMRRGRPELVLHASRFGIYVGNHTLEVDIVPLLADEMVTAFNDLVTGRIRQRNFAKAVEAIRAAAGSATAEQREALLSRIEKVGKGRYAQRLAAHASTMNLRERVVDLLDADQDEALDSDDLLDVPGCGSLLALLDDLRVEVEQLPLLPTEDEYQAWLELDEADDDYIDDFPADQKPDAEEDG